MPYNPPIITLNVLSRFTHKLSVPAAPRYFILACVAKFEFLPWDFSYTNCGTSTGIHWTLSQATHLIRINTLEWCWENRKSLSFVIIVLVWDYTDKYIEQGTIYTCSSFLPRFLVLGLWDHFVNYFPTINFFGRIQTKTHLSPETTKFLLPIRFPLEFFKKPPFTFQSLTPSSRNIWTITSPTLRNINLKKKIFFYLG